MFCVEMFFGSKIEFRVAVREYRLKSIKENNIKVK